MFQLRRLTLWHGAAVGALFGVFSGVVLAQGAGPASADGLVMVTHVIDGDTVEIEGGERVRLLGIDTPEDKRIRKSKDGGKRLVPAQPFFIEAKRLLRELVAKQRVRIAVGAESVGYYGRTIAQLHLPDGTDVQQALLRRGYAMVVAYPPNIAHLQDYGATEAEACRAGRGLWGHPHFALQTLEDGAAIRSGLGRVVGTVTAVARRNNDVRLNLDGRLTLLIYRGAWRKFWRGRAEDLMGRRLIARGRIKSAGRRHILRIRHPFMLRERECAAWRPAANH
ncbi:MAG: thermonuclease family protein [Gammaproteobacteria bacterium]|nr:thermonuclease family protein [Gammaproteobacteria bacterium]